ncbi:MAG: response regulator transcription factor [Gemmatimonadota bacterium]|nr:response regulator transcription factor [Gemmatimonadota bacterium]
MLADDHAIVRRGLARLLDDQRDMEVVGEVGSASELTAAMPVARPHVVVLDVSMPGPGIAGVLKELRESWPTVRALVLSMYPEEQYAERVLRSGAAGYVTKDRSPELLVEAVRKIHRGGVFVTATLAEHLAGRVSDPEPKAGHARLSDRELDVLRALAAGKSVKAIAAGMRLSPKTVSTYRFRLMEKLRLETNADLIRYAIEHGLTAG